MFDGRFVYFVPYASGAGGRPELLLYDTQAPFADPPSWSTIATPRTGPASVTFLLISELYPQQVRGPAMSVATVAIWSSFLVMTFTFLTTLNWLGESATFWAYGLLSLVAMGLVYRKVPETKGKDLEEISRSLAGGK